MPMLQALQVYEAGNIKLDSKGGKMAAVIPKLMMMPTWVLKGMLGPMMKSDARTSMGEDVVLGRFDNEVEYLNGAIVELGAEFGVATPVNSAVLALMKKSKPLPVFTSAELVDKVGEAVLPKLFLSCCG